VHLHVASYGTDAATGDLVNDELPSADPRWWAAADRHRSIAGRDGTLHVHEIELRSADDSLLVWYWYVVDGQATGNDYRAKLLLARERLLRRPQGGDRIAVFTRPSSDVDAETVLQAFVSQLSMATSTAVE